MKLSFLVDLRTLIAQKVIQYHAEIAVAAVNFLNLHALVVIVNQVGLLRFNLDYCISQVEDETIVVECLDYISGDLTYQLQGEARRLVPFSNALFIQYESLVLDSRQIDSNMAKVASGDYFIACLSRGSEQNQWRVNLVHFFQNKNSEEILSVPVAHNGRCLDIYFDQLSPKQNYELNFLVFCILEKIYPSLYRVTLNVVPHLLINTSSFVPRQQESEFRLNVTATNILNREHAKSEIVLRIADLEPQLTVQLVGLVGGVVVATIYVMLAYTADKISQLIKKQEEKEEKRKYSHLLIRFMRNHALRRESERKQPSRRNDIHATRLNCISKRGRKLQHFSFCKYDPRSCEQL